MTQKRVKINGQVVKQPDHGLGYDFETTYTKDSVRVQSGVLHITPMFTVESFSYTASNLTIEEMKNILQMVAKGRPFKLHYLSSYYGEWREDWFYVGNGSMKVGTWKESEECYENLSFKMIGVNPI